MLSRYRNKNRGNKAYVAASSPDCGANSLHKIITRSFENVAQNIWGMTLTNQNLIQEEIKRRLNSGYPCFHSV
jgi:hypothetical protein